MELESLSSYYIIFLVLSVGIQVINFSLSYFMRIDNFTGSMNFCAVAILSYLWSGCNNIKQKMLTTMLLIWSVRLGTYLLYRMYARNKGDDRLDKLRKTPPVLLVFWISHTMWCYIVSLPITLFNLVLYSNKEYKYLRIEVISEFCYESFQLSYIEYIGLIVWLYGMFFATIGDYQKFKHYQSMKGKKYTFCDVGIWKWSRNPNFAGEIILWLGVAIISSYNLYINKILLSTNNAMYIWCLICVPFLSPFFTFLVLTLWSGLPFRERKYWKKFGKKNKKYNHYRNTTSILWPLPPGMYSLIPDFIKTVAFCEWKMFEWRPKSKRKSKSKSPRHKKN